ncbi:MAG: hypothetical protein ACI843_002522 [Psychrobacter glaciei]|jgi:hypothetical protein
MCLSYSKEILDKLLMKKHSKFDKILLVSCGVFFTILFINGLLTGQVSPKGGEDYFLENSPNMFYFILGVYFVLTGACIFELLRNKIKFK